MPNKKKVRFDINYLPSGSTTTIATAAVPIASWKTVKHSIATGQLKREDLIEQGQCLCGQYIRARLKRSGMLNRKVMQRLRIIIDTPTTITIRNVFPALNILGEELERMHPRTYSNVSRQLSRSPFGELQEAHTAPILLHTVARELFRNNDINWTKIISLFAVSGGLAVDIVRQGHYDYLQRLIEGTGDIIEEELVPWLLENGGWIGLLDYLRPSQLKISFLSWFTIIVAILMLIYLILCTFKYIGSNYLLHL